MKITKRQLRRIIKEEKAKLMTEGPPTVTSAIPAGEKIWFAISSLIDQWMSQASPEEYGQIADDLRGYADDVEDSVSDAPSDDFMDVDGFSKEMDHRSRR